MTKETVTLIAASVAAVASFLGLFLNLRAQRRAELRIAQRQILNNSITELGEALYQCVACVDIILKAKSDNSHASWKKRGSKASSKLKTLRPKLRYPLWE